MLLPASCVWYHNGVMQNQEYTNELESLFPAECHLKIVVENVRGVRERVETALLRFGVESPLTVGNLSAGGKYRTLNVSLTIEDRETMFRLDNALCEVDGVRMVM